MSSSSQVKIVGAETPNRALPAPAAAYANVSRVFATPNEVVLDFAMNLDRKSVV